MNSITKKFILAIDAKLITENVMLHSRPFHTALAWMSEENLSCDIFDENIWNPMMDIYRRLYPSGDFSTPALFIGGAAIRDRMYAVHVNVGYGAFSIDPLTCRV